MPPLAANRRVAAHLVHVVGRLVRGPSRMTILGAVSSFRLTFRAPLHFFIFEGKNMFSSFRLTVLFETLVSYFDWPCYFALLSELLCGVSKFRKQI